MTNPQTLWIRLLSAALLAAVFSIAATPFVRRMTLKYGPVRQPRDRDMHQQPTPLWGGIAMFVAFVLTVLVLRPFNGQAFSLAEHGSHPILGILLGGTIVALFGLLDDKYDLKPWQQILALLSGSLVAALLGARIEGVTNPFAPSTGGLYDSRSYIALGFWSIPVTVIWITAITKLFDFLDGLDGLAAGVCAIAATTLALLSGAHHPPDTAVALMAAALAGSCIGFLRHNYNPASIFMGSVGSFFLGYILAALAVVGAVKGPTVISVAVPLLVLGVPVFDGIYVIARRLLTGQKPMSADKTHIHHRLTGYGWSTKKTVLAIYGLTACTCLVALILAWNWAR